MKIALALRSPLYIGNEILEFVKLADKKFSYLFFPEVSSGYDSIEISAAALGCTTKIKAGSGVLRPLEHDTEELVRRIATIQFLTNNRFILGIGTGSPGANPSETIANMVAKLDEIKSEFKRHFKGEIKMPEVFVAALKRGIAKKTIDYTDGLLLNFCSPTYAKNLIQTIEPKKKENKMMSCYLKMFYSKDHENAKRMLVEEFANYDRYPSYHEMFKRAGVSDEISRAKKGEIPESLLEISRVNPSTQEVQDFVNSFREAGVDLPCIYPYFSSDDDTHFKTQVMNQILQIS